MTRIIKNIRNYHPHIAFDDLDWKYLLFERRVKSIFLYF